MLRSVIKLGWFLTTTTTVVQGFTVPLTAIAPRTKTGLSSTKAPEIASMPTMTVDYSEEEMKNALASLAVDSEDASHIYGNGDDGHKLSMLQTITATRILDYAAWMVSKQVE